MSKNKPISFEYEIESDFEYLDEKGNTQFIELILAVGEAYSYYDSSWGADADGNRGMPIYEIEIESINTFRWNDETNEYVDVPISTLSEQSSRYIFSYVEEKLLEEHKEEKYGYIN